MTPAAKAALVTAQMHAAHQRAAREPRRTHHLRDARKRLITQLRAEALARASTPSTPSPASIASTFIACLRDAKAVKGSRAQGSITAS
jgi:hypothetical protein